MLIEQMGDSIFIRSLFHTFLMKFSLIYYYNSTTFYFYNYTLKIIKLKWRAKCYVKFEIQPYVIKIKQAM